VFGAVDLVFVDEFFDVLDPLLSVPLVAFPRLVVNWLAVVLSVELLVEVVVSEGAQELLQVGVGAHSFLCDNTSFFLRRLRI